MSDQDDLQKLWQDEVNSEGSPMWRELVKEKRKAWNELVRAEDQTWYLIALTFIPLTTLAAWKAKYPWVHVGYALMSATIVVSTLATWIASHHPTQERDRNLREYLESLVESYTRRCVFLRRLGLWAMAGLTLGVTAVVLGIPGNVSSSLPWIITLLAVAGANITQWLFSRQSAAKIQRKRDEADKLLQTLVSGR